MSGRAALCNDGPMAKTVVVKLTDDIDGGDADESIQFSLDGRSYEIDLNSANAAKLREASPEPARAPQLAHEAIVGGVWAVIGSYAVRKRVKYLPSLIDHLAFIVLAPYVGPKLAAQTIDTARRRLAEDARG